MPIPIPIRLPHLRFPHLLPPDPDRLSKLLQDRDRRIPIDTRVGNTDTLLQCGGAFGRDFLVSFVDVGFDHDADDAGFAFAELVADCLCDERLVAVIFVGVACFVFLLVCEVDKGGDWMVGWSIDAVGDGYTMRAVDHHNFFVAFLSQRLARGFDAVSVKICAFAAAS